MSPGAHRRRALRLLEFGWGEFEEWLLLGKQALLLSWGFLESKSALYVTHCLKRLMHK